MIRERPPAPMAGRVDARLPITPALVAAAAGVTLEVATRHLAAWCDAVTNRCANGDVLIFDQVVVGPNAPILLEGWHAVRSAARAEASGLFDELEERWYDVHAERCGDDCEHSFEQLDVTDWALWLLRSGWCGERFTDGRRVVARAVVVDADNVMDVVRVELAIERLMAELADAITVGGCPVVDARLPIVRSDGLRWAA
ncbi:hypothetical protein BDK89_0199 [Ilumatobacter fluminis]|uniref:Uncharacterized protein n=1 Tax=Ilumatobacter fluminis TaxID=467091 RepID=A0A4R7HVW1_9ACTN|nr:hypothetical protein [Ilumatobacter fluminis]TDT14644.1 hypothetical protein BDK89_0199 [Ilumatobacter fluminis]